MTKTTGYHVITIGSVLVFAIFLQCNLKAVEITRSTAASKNSKEGSMNATEMRINRVLEIKEDASKHIFQISTDRSGQLWLNVGEFGNDDVQLLFETLVEKKPIVIEFDQKTKKIVWINYVSVDRILDLSDSRESGEEIQVHAMKRPSLLVLRKDAPRFNELYSLLSKALAEGDKGVKAALASSGKYIQDVLLVEPAPKN